MPPDFQDFLRVQNSNNGVDATLRTVTDGKGDPTPLRASTTEIAIDATRATGGTALRPLGDQLRDEGFHVADFGAVGNGSTDDAPAIQAGINAVAARGGGVLLFDALRYRINSTLSVTTKSVTLRGVGGDGNHNIGVPLSSCTILAWGGAGGGTMVEFRSPVGVGNQCMTGGGLDGVALDCVGSAARGLVVKSWRKATFSRVHVQNATTWCFDIGVNGPLGEDWGVQECLFDRLSTRGLDGAGVNGGGMVLDGDATSNTSLNVFDQVDIIHLNGDGLSFRNSDGNRFIRPRVARAGGGTGRSIVMHGSNTSVGECARGNVLEMTSNFGGIGGIFCLGTDVYTHPSFGNAFYNLDVENATAPPVISPGATAIWSDTVGKIAFEQHIQAAFGEDIFAVQEAFSRRAGAAASIFSSEGHLRLIANAAGNPAWLVRVLTGGDFEIARTAGTGRVLLDGQRLIPWGAVAWAPTFTPSGGAFGSVSVISARYAQFGKTVQGEVVWQIVTVGTATGDILFTLPVNSSGNATCIGLDASFGRILVGQSTTTQMSLYRESGLSPIAAGNFYRCSFTYEAA